MNLRKRRSNSEPRAASSWAIWSGVSMPGISIGCSIPGITWPRGSAGGTSSLCSRSHRCTNAISSFWATTMRSHRMRTDGLAPCDGAQPAINTACAWWPIMPAMNRTSAAVYGGRPPSARACAAGARVAWWTAPVVHAAVAITTRYGVFIRLDLPAAGYCTALSWYEAVAGPPRSRGGKLSPTLLFTRSPSCDGAHTGRPATNGYDRRGSAQTRDPALHRAGRRDDHRAADRDEPGAVHGGAGAATAGADSGGGEYRERVGGLSPGVAGPRGDRRGSQLRADVCHALAAGEDR